MKSEANCSARVKELERICAELHQVIGAMAGFADIWCHPDVVRAMDNASAAKLEHKNLLPWPRTPLCRDSDVAAVRFAMKRKKR